MDHNHLSVPHTKSQSLIAIIALLTGCTLIVISLFLYRETVQLRAELSNQPATSIAVAQPAARAEITWKTYQDPSGDFSFSYPSNLEPKAFENFGISLWNAPVPTEIPMEAPHPPIHIMVDERSIDAKLFVSQRFGDSHILREEDAKIDLMPVKVIVSVLTEEYAFTDNILYTATIANAGKTYIFQLDKTLYNNVSDFYHLLESVRFTESSVQTKNWKKSSTEKPFLGLPYTFLIPDKAEVRIGTGAFTHIIIDSTMIEVQNLGKVPNLESAIAAYRPGGSSDPSLLEPAKLLSLPNLKAYTAQVKGGGFMYTFIEGTPETGVLVFGHSTQDSAAENYLTKMLQSMKY